MMDAGGSPIVVTGRQLDTNHPLEVARLVDGSWTIETLSEACGTTAAVAYHPDSGPAILHRIFTDGTTELWLHWQRGGTWTSELVAVGTISYVARVQFDGAGRPVVAWIDHSSGAARVGRWSPDAWEITTASAETRPVEYLDLAIDRFGEPLLVLLGFRLVEDVFEIARWDGAAWAREPIASTVPLSSHLELEVDSNGLAWVGSTSNEGIVLQRESSDGTWSREVVASEDGDSWSVISLLLDGSDRPRIAATTADGVVLLQEDGGVWSRDPLPTSARWLSRQSLALGTDGQLFLGLHFSSPTAMVPRESVHVWHDEEGWGEVQSWGVGYPGGRHRSLAIDSTGAPASLVTGVGTFALALESEGARTFSAPEDGAGSYRKLAAGPDGALAVAAQGPREFRVLHLVEGTWTLEVFPDYFGYHDIAYGRDGVLHVSVTTATGLFHGRRDETGWLFSEVVDLSETGIEHYHRHCLGLERDGQPIIAFGDSSGSGELGVARRVDGRWELDVIAAGNGDCDLATADDGSIGVVHRGPGDALSFARLMRGEWVTDDPGHELTFSSGAPSLTFGLDHEPIITASLAALDEPAILRRTAGTWMLETGLRGDLQVSPYAYLDRSPTGEVVLAHHVECRAEGAYLTERPQELRVLRTVTDFSPGWRDRVRPFDETNDVEDGTFPAAVSVPVELVDPSTDGPLTLYRTTGTDGRTTPGRLRVLKTADDEARLTFAY
ncbi:MAG: hypothetical protein AAF533_21330 [Acidobacteriota bacterium]